MSLKNPRDRVRSYRDGLDTGDALKGLSGRRSQEARRRKILGTVLVICAVVAVLVAADYWANAGKIYRGVAVGDVSLSGNTPEEARQAIEERSANGFEEIRFTGGPQEFALDAGEIDLSFDVAGTVDRAYAVGREGSIPKRFGDRIAAAWGTVSTAPVVDYDREAVRTRIENTARRTNAQPRDAYVKINGSEAQVVESREGYEMDVPATAANVDGAFESMSGEARVAGEALEPGVLTPAAEEAAGPAEEAMSEPGVLTSGGQEWELSPEEIGQSLSFTPEGGEITVGLDQEQLREAMSDVYDDLTVEPVEAGYRATGNGVSVTPSRTGKEIEEEEFFGAIAAGLFEGTREYEIPVVTDEPELTTGRAESLKPTELLGSYRTDYTLSSDKSPERVENLDIASGAISGTFLAPGEIFSANDVLSPLDYNETKVIILGREEKADGGGLCQVSSTLYMAANYAGLDIVERNPHYAQLPYIRPGLDATVWFGALDMKFENTTDGYVLLKESVGDDGYIYAEIWGQPTGKTVEMDSEPEYLGSDYSEWITYQKVTDEDGEVVFDDVLHKDTYKPLVDDKGKTVAPNDPYLNIADVNY